MFPGQRGGQAAPRRSQRGGTDACEGAEAAASHHARVCTHQTATRRRRPRDIMNDFNRQCHGSWRLEPGGRVVPARRRILARLPVEHERSSMNEPFPALLTDLYQLTMAQAYFEEGLAEEAVFELFVRTLPPARRVLIAAGLEQVIEYLEGL